MQCPRIREPARIRTQATLLTIMMPAFLDGALRACLTFVSAFVRILIFLPFLAIAFAYLAYAFVFAFPVAFPFARARLAFAVAVASIALVVSLALGAEEVQFRGSLLLWWLIKGDLIMGLTPFLKCHVKNPRRRRNLPRDWAAVVQKSGGGVRGDQVGV